MVHQGHRLRGRDFHYLVQWLGYGPEFDQWLPGSELIDTDVILDYNSYYSLFINGFHGDLYKASNDTIIVSSLLYSYFEVLRTLGIQLVPLLLVLFHKCYL